MESLLSAFRYKSDIHCSVCKGQIKDENCSPQSCDHIFHNMCLEQWIHSCQSSDEFACPAVQCNASFSEIVYRKKPHGKTTMVVSLKEFTQCPICCEKLTPPVATPESCNHIFCYTCLNEWSRVRHECPLDRGKFELILLFDRIGGPVSRRIAAPPVRLPSPETPPEELETNCEICSRPDDEARLLLCDHCDRGYHIYCLPVPLPSVPSGDWFCPDCVRHGIGQTASASTTAGRSRGRTRQRVLQVVRPLAELEAEESERSHLNSSSTTTRDSSRGEIDPVPHELSRRSQLRLAQRAIRRYRGRQLFHDTITQLADRIVSEAASRNHRQRLRTRRALRSDNMSSWAEQPDQPISTQNTAPSTSRTASGDENRNPRSTVTTRSRSNRKRLLVLSSDSDSQEEDQHVSHSSGIPLRLPSMARPRTRLLRPSDSESDTEEDQIRQRQPASTALSSRPSDISPNRPAPPRSRVEATSSDQGPSQLSVHSLAPADAETHRTPGGSDQRPSTSRSTATARSAASRRRQPKRPREVSRSRRSGKRAKSRRSRSSKRRNRQPVMNKVQKRLKKAMVITSRSTRQVNNHRPAPVVREAVLESLDGRQTSRNYDPSLVPSTSYSNTNKHDPVTSKYFRTINAPHSNMVQRQSPAPPINQTRLPGGDQATCHQLQPAPKPPTAVSESALPSPVTTSTRYAGALPETICQPPVPPSSLTSTPNGEARQHQVPRRQEVVWSPGRIRKAQSILMTTLQAHLRSGLINQQACSEILQRAIFKIKQKEPAKVTDGRIIKLATDYVHYYSKRKSELS